MYYNQLLRAAVGGRSALIVFVPQKEIGERAWINWRNSVNQMISAHHQDASPGRLQQMLIG